MAHDVPIKSGSLVGSNWDLPWQSARQVASQVTDTNKLADKINSKCPNGPGCGGGATPGLSSSDGVSNYIPDGVDKRRSPISVGLKSMKLLVVLS